MVDVVSIVIAVISFVGSFLTAGITGWSNQYTEDRMQRAETKKLIAKYRTPLLLAAQKLQSRLRAITKGGILLCFDDDDDDSDEMMENLNCYTCYLVGQFLAWALILRSQAPFPRFSDDKGQLLTLIDNIQNTFTIDELSSQYATTEQSRPSGNLISLWPSYHQAIGEIMTIKSENGERVCMGYTTFIANWRDTSTPEYTKDMPLQADKPPYGKPFRAWFDPHVRGIRSIAEDYKNPEGAVRGLDGVLRNLQDELDRLIKTIDPKNQIVDGEGTKSHEMARRGWGWKIVKGGQKPKLSVTGGGGLLG